MSEAIDAVISSAMASLDNGGNDGENTGDSGSGGDTGDSSTSDLSATDTADTGTDAGGEGQEADTSGQPPATDTPADEGRSAEDLALDAELAELGIAAPKPGQRDNRIPYSRIRKIVANAKTKWSEKLKGEHTAELTARETKIQEYEERAKEFAAAEHLIETDPDRYIELLGQIYPDKYRGFTKAQAIAAEKREMADAPQEPPPDVKYEDGSFGYSPEQFLKLREYDRQEAARVAMEQATKTFNDRFGPIEREYQESKKNAQDIQRVRGHIGKLRDQWGADLIDSPEVQKEIIAHLDANPKATLVAAARAVAMKRISADRTKMRAEILKELQKAPKAAAKAPVSPTQSDKAADDQSIEDIIRYAARSIR
jgi:hypothetical protein